MGPNEAMNSSFQEVSANLSQIGISSSIQIAVNDKEFSELIQAKS